MKTHNSHCITIETITINLNTIKVMPFCYCLNYNTKRSDLILKYFLVVDCEGCTKSVLVYEWQYRRTDLGL